MIDVLTGAVELIGQVSAKPDPNGLPGSNAAEKLVNGIFFFVLLACLAGFLISSATWAIASRAQNHQYTQNGKIGVMVAAAAAFLAGAGPAIINFFIDAGRRQINRWSHGASAFPPRRSPSCPPWQSG